MVDDSVMVMMDDLVSFDVDEGRLGLDNRVQVVVRYRFCRNVHLGFHDIDGHLH